MTKMQYLVFETKWITTINRINDLWMLWCSHF